MPRKVGKGRLSKRNQPSRTPSPANTPGSSPVNSRPGSPVPSVGTTPAHSCPISPESLSALSLATSSAVCGLGDEFIPDFLLHPDTEEFVVDIPFLNTIPSVPDGLRKPQAKKAKLVKGKKPLDIFVGRAAKTATTALTATITTATTTTTTTVTTTSVTTTIFTATSSTSNPVGVGPSQKFKFRRSIVEDVDEIEPADTLNETRLFSRAHINTIINNTACSKCLIGKFVCTYKGSGAGGYTVWQCDRCPNKFNTQFKNVTGGGYSTSYPNFATTYMALRNDTGYQATSRLLSGIHLNPGCESIFYRQWCPMVYDLHQSLYDTMMDEIHNRVKKFYLEKLNVIPDENGLLPIMVSFDATYPKRGKHSLFANAYIVEAFLGEALSYKLLAKCATCHFSGNKDKEKCPDQCPDFHGASGNMEGPLVKSCFDESELFGLRYDVIICDGDSSAYNHIKDYYGKDSVTKELCGNHVGKLIVSSIQQLRDTHFTTRITKGGKNPGSEVRSWTYKGKEGLDDAKINKVGNYYQHIVKDTSLSTAQKQKHIMGLYKHYSDSALCTESDTHDDCYQVGRGCPWRNAKFNKTQMPPRKQGIFSKWRNSGMALTHIENIFKRLSDESLLDRTSHGLTQNINESLHSKQHAMSNKHKFHSKARLNLICQVNVLIHNYGHEKACLLNYVGYGTSDVFLKVLQEEDKESARVASRPPGQARSSKAQRGHWQPPAADYRPGHFPD